MKTDDRKELRVLAAPQRLELRKTNQGQTLTGQAVVYGALSGDLGGFVERIAPGAFAASLREQDVLCLFSHDDSAVLGRQSAGTLTIRDTPSALEFSCVLPDTSVGRDVSVLCERGDLKGMSFGFICTDDDWQQNGTQVVRTVKQAELFEVSVVAFPAYSQSTVSLRTCPPGLRCKLHPSADEDEARTDALRIRQLFAHKMKHI